MLFIQKSVTVIENLDEPSMLEKEKVLVCQKREHTLVRATTF